jgi:hypothetical protein
MLDVQNGFLHWVGRLPAASFDGLQLGVPGVVACYLLLAVVYSTILSRNLR